MGWNIEYVIDGFKDIKKMVNNCDEGENLNYLKKELMDLVNTITTRLSILGHDKTHQRLSNLVEACKKLPFHLLDRERRRELDAADIEYHFEVILGVMREIREQLLEILDG